MAESFCYYRFLIIPQMQQQDAAHTHSWAGRWQPTLRRSSWFQVICLSFLNNEKIVENLRPAVSILTATLCVKILHARKALLSWITDLCWWGWVQINLAWHLARNVDRLCALSTTHAMTLCQTLSWDVHELDIPTSSTSNIETWTSNPFLAKSHPKSQIAALLIPGSPIDLVRAEIFLKPGPETSNGSNPKCQ